MPYAAEGCTAIKFSLPSPSVPPETILCTAELRRRRSRPPDYKKENRALMKLAGAMATSSSNILQTLVETILEVAQCEFICSLHDNKGRSRETALLACCRRDVGRLRRLQGATRFRPERRWA